MRERGGNEIGEGERDRQTGGEGDRQTVSDEGCLRRVLGQHIIDTDLPSPL